MSDTGPRTTATDAQERAMVDDAHALHRDKHVARTAAALMIPGGLLALLAALAVASGADPAAPRLAALLPLAAFLGMAYVALTRMVVRTAVTRAEVLVQWGLSEHRIPLPAITACEARPVTGGPTMATGAGWALLADRGSVLLSWTDAGATKRLLFPAKDPDALAAQIDAARVMPATGVRVATDAAPVTSEASAEDGRGHGSGHDARSPARVEPARRDG
jgi:hypothetical protein